MPDDSPGPKDLPIEELMAQLIPQARTVAWKHWHSAPYVLEFDELVSLAYRGLVEAKARWPLYCESHGYDPALTRYFRTILRLLPPEDERRNLGFYERPGLGLSYNS